MSSLIRKAVVPAAGKGTRLYPATQTIPKEMLPIVDKPLIHYIVEEAQQAGISTVILITGKGKSAMEDYLDGTEWPGMHFLYIRQKTALGLGHAISLASPAVEGEPFAVLLPDDLIASPTGCLAQMVQAFAQEDYRNSNMLGLAKVPELHTQRYGIVEVESQHGSLIRAKGIVEKPTPSRAPSRFAAAGRYILQPEVFARLEEQKPGANGEVQLTDSLQAMLPETPLSGLLFEGERFDCGNKLGYMKACISTALQRKEFRKELLEFLSELKAEEL